MSVYRCDTSSFTSLPFPSLPVQFSSVQNCVQEKTRKRRWGTDGWLSPISGVPDSVSAREPLLSTIIPFELLSFRITTTTSTTSTEPRERDCCTQWRDIAGNSGSNAIVRKAGSQPSSDCRTFRSDSRWQGNKSQQFSQSTTTIATSATLALLATVGNLEVLDRRISSFRPLADLPRT